MMLLIQQAALPSRAELPRLSQICNMRSIPVGGLRDDRASMATG
jgi:hypothetical protein